MRQYPIASGYGTAATGDVVHLVGGGTTIEGNLLQATIQKLISSNFHGVSYMDEQTKKHSALYPATCFRYYVAYVVDDECPVCYSGRRCANKCE